ncbi:MAG TPA: Flp family type IVb pilin [Caulobacteraceae bacterium]|jgi:Flp pilus assembly pilin Flp
MFKRYLIDNSGASSAEYALILAMVAIVVVGGILAVQGAIITGLSSMDSTFGNLGY